MTLHRLVRVDAPPAAYLHIPFCNRICPYCDFAVVEGRDSEAERYVAAVILEIDRSTVWEPLGALFIGGGTPSSIAPNLIGDLVAAIRAKHGLESDAEITMESNPEDWTLDIAEEMRATGVNRLSMGAQSFDEKVLGALGRRHSPEQIEDAFSHSRAAGFGSVSIDLIFGHPVETADSWKRTLERTMSLEPDHVSTYALTVELGTQLSRDVASGAPSPDDDVQADRYEMAQEVLGASLERYEVSNYAKPGHECLYNRRVWNHGSYEAYGLGAHGYREGVRFRNVRSLDAYLKRVEIGRSPRQGSETITGWDKELERLMVGLRRIEGVKLGSGGSALLESPEGERFLGAGVIDVDDDWLVVQNPLLTDAVIRVVLGLEKL
jgi:putative oxygen-independent coproporphyrinogen III oxidase